MIHEAIFTTPKKESWRTSLLLNLGCLIAILLASIITLNQSSLFREYSNEIALAVGGLMTIAAVVQRHFPRLSRLGIFSGLLCALYLSLSSISFAPSLGYLMLVVSSVFSFVILQKGKLTFDREGKNHNKIRTLGFLSLGALLNWLLVYTLDTKDLLAANVAVLTSSYICLSAVLTHTRFRSYVTLRSSLTSYLVLFVLFLVFRESAEVYLRNFSLAAISVPLFTFIFVARKSSARLGTKNALFSLFAHAEGALITCFFALCAIGSLLLYSPLSQKGNHDYIDSLFTAVSAACITGLTVLDTAKDFTFFGQATILFLIQLGGIGIMSISSLAIFLFGDVMSLRHEKAFVSVYGQKFKGEMKQVLNSVLLFTLFVESLGALILFLRFSSKGMPLLEAVWNAVFTSISAFCNAGFAINSDNLVAYRDDPFILYSISVLVIIGGLSPGFVFGIRSWRKFHPQNLQHRIIAFTSLALLTLGTFLFFGFESNASMAGLSFFDKLSNSFFLSTVARTAGFNTFDVSTFSSATLFCLLFLMFIGGSPGGTAGGIKTTCFAVIVMTVYSTLRGRTEVTFRNREIAPQSIRRAFVVLSCALGVVFTATLSLLVTQNLTLTQALFEVVSALATVGLSLNVSPTLDSAGKIIIMLCMFSGRVGVLAIFFYLSERQISHRPKIPYEEITVA